MKKAKLKTKMKMKTKTTKNKSPTGVVTALVTPFKKGAVDYKSLKRLVRHQLDNGVEGFVVSGTTAESPTITTVEVEKIFKCVAKESDRAVPLILGVGSNSTLKTIANLSLAHKLKADGVLVVVPYYNKPPQRGLYEHFSAVAKKSKLPMLLYNVPGRTVISMSAETTCELSRIPKIIGIKEASGNLEHLENIKRGMRENFLLISGDDATAVDFALRGGKGVISVVSHLIPKSMTQIFTKATLGQVVAKDEYKSFETLNKLMGVEANPIPVKMGLYLMGIIDSPELRLPLVTLANEHKISLESELRKLGLI